MVSYQLRLLETGEAWPMPESDRSRGWSDPPQAKSREGRGKEFKSGDAISRETLGGDHMPIGLMAAAGQTPLSSCLLDNDSYNWNS